MTAVYSSSHGTAVEQGAPLISALTPTPRYDQDKLIAALRRDQQGDSTYPEFMIATWQAGVLTYDVDLTERTCTYIAATGQRYIESYPRITLND